jgi:S-adenosylmethionine:tRNA ribosyltransferase-isomerase
MLVSQFNFELPKQLIATAPVKPRDSANLLVVGDGLQNLKVRDLTSFFKRGDVVVFNDTKVIPAKLYGKKAGASVEATLHKQIDAATWLAFAKPARKLSVGDIFKIADGFYAQVLEKNEGEVRLQFNLSGEEFFKMLDKYGVPPLPPYIERQGRKPISSDFYDYQTIYAKNKGAVAAPTAGLHFTEELLEEIAGIGVIKEFVTLHVGAGTFLPMKVADTQDHKMHAEYGVITREVADRINAARKKGGRVIAVGTTSLRLLESATGEDKIIRPFSQETDIFITPGYKFKAVDILLTNFHLPESTLFMLVCAFAGMEKMKKAYSHAVANKYRFYSYGDACLLIRAGAK